ncbi:MAG: Gfo/Idh/MocA family oxidoreductase [Planctomycetaceae bacterium]|nr:Gfo/Idh/MocA family oxidoreductase [Planctomycetaceae bacterium]
MSSRTPNLRIALIGCGQIADAHLQEIRKIDCAELVAVCDVHQDLADQAAARFGVPRADSDLSAMLAEAKPDVVHVTTPAHTHCELATRLLVSGVHVYVEKPLTVDFSEAESLLETVTRTGKSLCLGHDQLFDPIWLRCRELVDAGVIGEVSHVESVLGYPLSGQFGRQVTGNPDHWVRRLPGGLFQNTISHPLYRITEYMQDTQPRVDAHWYAAGTATFPTEMVAHLRGKTVTGSLFFSTRIQPQRISRVYGPKGGLEVDFDAQTIRVIRQSRLPGAFGKIEMPWRHWREGASNLRHNLWRFLKSDIHYFAGMRTLFELYYRSILDGSSPPIAYDEMLRVTRVMDTMFRHCRVRTGAKRLAALSGASPRLSDRKANSQSEVDDLDEVISETEQVS